ncbi:hypothetical protein [Acidovorax sp.]|uniref:hypothetical protein n=1 Tax=Acidovorax sp. TaxID=1872122 RepID=UPI003CFF96AB
MATCIFLEVSGTGPGTAVSATGKTVLPWSVGDATYSAGQYGCSVGSHLVMTIAEVNAMPKTGVPDEVLMRDNFFMSFTLVLSCYLLGKFVGAVLHLVRKG